MLRYCMRVWWERVGMTQASGLTKLMMSEGANFPDLAEFYRREVVRPGHELLRRIFQRGIDSGEFTPMDVDHAIYSVVAPMVFLMLWKHSAMVCVDGESALDPEKYLATQAEVVINGLCVRPGRPTAAEASSATPKIEGLS
jgi:hypothetical protein